MIYRLLPTRVYRSYMGGKQLDLLEGIDPPTVSRFPEDWLGSVTEAFNPGRDLAGEGLTRIDDGRILRDVISASPETMLGGHEKMSLLFKLLDSEERLVIQAHPTVAFAKERWNSPFGKTECWYFLADGGSVYLGFREGITKERWMELFETQDVEGMLACLHRFEVSRGELVFVPGGVPHAIGAGCFLAELQEPTDLMVIPERFTPSGVELPDAKLHGGLGFEEMFDCFTYEGYSRKETSARYIRRPKPCTHGVTELVGRDLTDRFRLEQINVCGSLSISNDSYGVLLVADGTGTVNGKEAKSGDRFFIPASEGELQLSGTLTLLRCLP